jgi:hypothetical protein
LVLSGALGALPFVACSDDESVAPQPGDFEAPPPRDDLTPEQRRIIDEVVGWQTLDHHVVVTGLPDPLPPGTVIETGPALEDVDQVLQPLALPALEEESLFFFIDDAPRDLFGHSVRYALLGRASKKIAVFNAAFPAAIAGAPILPTTHTELYAPPYLIYTTSDALLKHPPPVAPKDDYDVESSPNALHVPCAAGGKPRRFGLVVSGGGNGSEQLDCAVGTMFDALVATGFHHVEGVFSGEPVQSIAQSIGYLAGAVQCCDEVYVHIAAHGGRYVRSGGFWVNCGQNNMTSDTPPQPCGPPFHWGVVIGGRFLSAARLAAELSKLHACHITMVVESCYAHGLRHALGAVNGVERLFTSEDEDKTGTYGTNGDCLPLSAAIAEKWNADELSKSTDLGKSFADVWKAATSSNAAGWHDTPHADARAGECRCCGDGKRDGNETCDPTASPTGCQSGQICNKDCQCQEDGGGGSGGDGGGGAGGAGGACVGMGQLCDIVANGIGTPPQPPGAPMQPRQQLWKGNCCPGLACSAGCDQGGEPGTCQGPTAQGVCVQNCKIEDCSFTSCLGCY